MIYKEFNLILLLFIDKQELFDIGAKLYKK